MFTTLDRALLFGYFRSYAIVLTSVLGLYITLDLFTNLDDFSKGGFLDNLDHMWRYYKTRVSQIFDRLSEAVSLLAAVFTVAWLQRNNELLPQLSAGISTRRVIRPVLFGAAVTLAVGPLNQELVIPRIAEELSINRDDPNNEAAVAVRGAFDPTGVHLEGYAGYRREQKVTWMSVTFPESGPAGMVHLTAREARYVPRGPGPHTGGWLLFQTSPEVATPLPANLEKIEENKYFLRTPDTDFDAITRPANWFVFASAETLRGLLARPDPRRQPGVAVAFHTRLTRPLVGVLMVLLGLAIILRDQNQNVFIKTGFCLVLVALFYAGQLGCKYLGEGDYVSPALAAWLPVLVFGPVAVVLFDAIHT